MIVVTFLIDNITLFCRSGFVPLPGECLMKIKKLKFGNSKYPKPGRCDFLIAPTGLGKSNYLIIKSIFIKAFIPLI